MRIIGLNGRLHSGKDTAYEAISQLIPTARRVAFADKLKVSAMSALGFFDNEDDHVTLDEQLAGANILKETGTITVYSGANRGAYVITGREYFQWYGTEAHRDVFGSDFWVNALLPREPHIDILFPGAEALVITDVRFHNEAIRIRELGGEVWRIDADTRLGPLPDDAHSSEQGLSDEYVDLVVDNNGALEHFIAGVTSAVDMGAWA